MNDAHFCLDILIDKKNKIKKTLYTYIYIYSYNKGIRWFGIISY